MSQLKIDEFLSQFYNWKRYGLDNGLLRVNDCGEIELTRNGTHVGYGKQKPILSPNGLQLRFTLDSVSNL